MAKKNRNRRNRKPKGKISTKSFSDEFTHKHDTSYETTASFSYFYKLLFNLTLKP